MDAFDWMNALCIVRISAVLWGKSSFQINTAKSEERKRKKNDANSAMV